MPASCSGRRKRWAPGSAPRLQRAGARGRRQPAPRGSAPVPAPRSCAQRPETPARPPWPADEAAPFPPRVQALTLGRFARSPVQVREEPRRPRLESRGGRRPGGPRTRGARCSRRGLAARRGVWVGARTPAAPWGCAPAGTFTLER